MKPKACSLKKEKKSQKLIDFQSDCKKKRANTNNTRNEKGSIITDPTDIKEVNKGYENKIHFIYTFYKLDNTDQLFERQITEGNQKVTSKCVSLT